MWIRTFSQRRKNKLLLLYSENHTVHKYIHKSSQISIAFCPRGFKRHTPTPGMSSEKLTGDTDAIWWEWLTRKANCPEKSYMPQECIRLSVFLTASGLSTRSWVMGQMPPLASVAAMTLALSQFTSMEQSWRKIWNESVPQLRKRLQISLLQPLQRQRFAIKILFFFLSGFPFQLLNVVTFFGARCFHTTLNNSKNTLSWQHKTFIFTFYRWFKWGFSPKSKLLHLRIIFTRTKTKFCECFFARASIMWKSITICLCACCAATVWNTKNKFSGNI